MLRPDSLWDQYHAKAASELLRGCGRWPVQPHPVALEPPWDPFSRDSLSVWDCMLHGWEAPYQGSWLWRMLDFSGAVKPRDVPVLLRPLPKEPFSRLVPLTIEQFVTDEATIAKTEQLFLALPPLHRPLSFEIWGVGATPTFHVDQAVACVRAGQPLAQAINGWTDPYTQIVFVADRDDAPALQRILLSHYPHSSIALGSALTLDFDPGMALHNDRGYAATFELSGWYCRSLKTFTRFDPDPLGIALAAMEQLGRNDWAALQILFQPAQWPWPATLRSALENPYRPGTWLSQDVEEKDLRDKFATPLFAVAIRVAAKESDAFRQLIGWAEQFATAPDQGLTPSDAEWSDDGMTDEGRAGLADGLMTRTTRRPGILLSAKELSGLVHLPGPNVVANRLKVLRRRTRPVADVRNEQGSVLLGDNVHQGQRREARISEELRARHCYIAGASGTGKSTLLLNMMVQDLQDGAGVGLLDPHGDLVKAVLARVPAHRVQDVILFDPTDTEHPFALNILEAHDDAERERIASETVMALERYFPSSWGPRLERILQNAVRTVLHALPGANLGDVERILTDDDFRATVVARTTDSRLRTFWETQYPFLGKTAADPVLNKLSVFLMNASVRNVICQRKSAIDFDGLLNGGKILLANLSTGLLTEKVAGMFGSFLVTKIVNAAFRRAAIPEAKRRPWYLYIDEFQAFMNVSVGFDRILTEARKYKLVLAGLANQYVNQLSLQVRQAIFGNVGTFVVFRLGVDDAHLVAKEMGGFTAEEILNLERGEAIARAGGAATAFNVETPPPPPVEAQDPTARIVAQTRQRYTRPRAKVEKELAQQGAPPAPSSKPSHGPAPSNGQARKRPPKSKPPTDPPTDDEDLVQ